MEEEQSNLLENDIYLTIQKPAYAAGQQVNGLVFVKMLPDIVNKKLIINFKGIELAQVYQNKIDFGKYKKYIFSKDTVYDQNTICNISIDVFNFSNDPNKYLEFEGISKLPFSFL